MTKELEEKIEELERRVKALEGTKASLQKTIGVLNRAVGKQNELRKEIERLKEEKNSQNQTLSAKEKELENKKEELKQLEEKIEDLNKKETDYKRQIRDLKRKIEDVNDEKEKDEKKIKDFQEKLDQAEADLKRVQQDLNNSEERRKELRRDINNLQDDLSKLRNEKSAELDEWVSKNTKLNKDLIEAKDRADKLDWELKELKSQQPTKKDNNEDDEKIKALEKDNQDLKEKNAKLEKEKEKLNETLTKFLPREREDLRINVSDYGSKVNISVRQVRGKYSASEINYEAVIDKETNFTNLILYEETLKAVICILAIEQSEGKSTQLQGRDRNSAPVRSLLRDINAIDGYWQEISTVEKQNNLLYLPFIDDWEKYQGRLNELKKKWLIKSRAFDETEQEKISERTFKNTFDIRKDKKYQELIGIRSLPGLIANPNLQKIEDYVEFLKEEYPELALDIKKNFEAIKNRLNSEFKRTKIITSRIETILRDFLEDRDKVGNDGLVNKFEEASSAKLDELFGKEAPLRFEKVGANLEKMKERISKSDVTSYGVDDIVFLVNVLCKELFLDYLPNLLKKNYLETEPVVDISELDEEEWSGKVENLFRATFEQLVNVGRDEGDGWDITEENINIRFNDLLGMIQEVKNNKIKPEELCRDPNHSDTPEEAQRKVREHLEKTEELYKELKNSGDPMFKMWYEKGKNSEILPLIEKALKTQGELVDYQQLDKEWGEVAKPDDPEYFGAWSTLKLLLKGWEKSVENNKLSEVVERILGPDYLSLILIETIK